MKTYVGYSNPVSFSTLEHHYFSNLSIIIHFMYSLVKDLFYIIILYDLILQEIAYRSAM